MDGVPAHPWPTKNCRLANARFEPDRVARAHLWATADATEALGRRIRAAVGPAAAAAPFHRLTASAFWGGSCPSPRRGRREANATLLCDPCVTAGRAECPGARRTRSPGSDRANGHFGRQGHRPARTADAGGAGAGGAWCVFCGDVARAGRRAVHGQKARSGLRNPTVLGLSGQPMRAL